ncbi:X2-like carbohydrate binding domain-containing protein [Clostridium hydrogenum]|uniref:X2-like carbohydrate binding domain-containing protein n=1 Tax=Clostridium hydrogenum TaxID=2855764 RepID=UPI002E343607|nr:X2-like carbohydrate binding domain-containing protein [Clostridium hydrogenum]
MKKKRKWIATFLSSIFLVTAISLPSNGVVHADTGAIISRIAGTTTKQGISGYTGDNGLATSATLRHPDGVAVGSSGNVYIADSSNNVIRKIDYSTGNITTIAGTGVSGYSGDNGLATSAKLGYPTGVAVDSSENVYIADTNNNVIRKIDHATGNISTIAGTGTSGYSGDNSLATSAKLRNPEGVAVDSSGNIYVADVYNQAIRKIDHSTGNISTIAGTGVGGYSGDGGLATSATLKNPSGVAVGSSGNVYIADTNNSVIRKIDHSTGNISTIAGTGASGYSGDNSLATSAKLKNPVGIAVDSSENIYVSDVYNQAIRKIDHATGNISTIAGTGAGGYSGNNGLATSATLNYPMGVAVDNSGNVYIADSSNNAVREIDHTTGNISTIVGTTKDVPAIAYSGDGGLATSAALSNPMGVVADSSGNVYIADSGNNAVRKIDHTTGNISTIAGTGTSGYSGDNGLATSAKLNMPMGVAVDSSGNVYIADSSNSAIRKIDNTTGNISTIAGTGTSGYSGDNGLATSATLYGPNGVAVDNSGNVYIADSGNNVVRKIDHITGNISTIAGTGTRGYSGDNGLATSATLYGPREVAIDNSGNVYIADSGNNVIRKIDHTTGNISTIAGTGTRGYSGDNGLATSATLNTPSGVAVDSSGNVYLADSSNSAIRKIDHETGTISTIAGNGTSAYGGDNGLATSATLSTPCQISVDSSGNVYIADKFNHEIRKISMPISSYTVTYDGNGNTNGTVPTDSNSYTSGTSVTAKDSGDLAKTNYTFAGWNTAKDGTGTAVAAGGSFNITGDTTLYAQWEQTSVPPALYINTIAGTGTAGYTGDGGLAKSAQLRRPGAVAVDNSGKIYIADTNNNVIREIDTGGNISTIAGTGTAGYTGDGHEAKSAQLNAPQGVAVDREGNVYIADTSNNVIREIDTGGNISTIAGTGTAGNTGDGAAAKSAKLNGPCGVAVDSKGNIFIADTSNNAIREVDTNKDISTIAGSGSDGSIIKASLFYPFGVAVDSHDNIYIADTTHDLIREIDTSGNMNTIAGAGMGQEGDGGYSGDGGLATNALLDSPCGVAVDSSGNVYISDTYNNLIRKVDFQTKKISTIAGRPGWYGGGYYGDGGLASSAEVNYPNGMAIDSSGNIYIADSLNNVIRKIGLPVSSYTLTYDGNGNTAGTVPTDSNSYTSGTSVTAKDSGDLAKANYKFAGWNTSQDGTGTAVAAGGSFNITRSTTLYAQWSPIVSSSLSINTASFDKNTANQADISIEMTLNGNDFTSITSGIYTLVNGTDYTVSGNTVTINKSYLASLSTGTEALVFNFSEGNPQTLNVTVTDTTPIAASGLTVEAAAETPAVSGKVNLTVTPAAIDANHKVYYQVVDSNPTALNVGDVITPSDWIEVTDANAHEIAVQNGKYIEAVEVTTADNKVTNWGKSGAIADGYIASSSLSTNTANFDKNTANQEDISIGLTLNGNYFTSITNGIYTLVNGTDYRVSGNTVTINKAYLASLGTGTEALVFNFSEGNPQTLNVTVTDTTPIAASGLTVTAAAETPAVSGKVNLTVTPAAQDSNHTMLYRIVNSNPTALNVGDEVEPGDGWIVVADTNAHEISVANGQYIEAIEVTNGDYKVTKWGKSSATADGYIAPVSSSLSTSTVNFDKNTANQADVSIGMTLNGNTLTSITNGTYTLVNGTDYTASSSLVTIKKSYLASLSTGVSTLVFNFSAGSSQSLSVIISDSTPGNASISPTTANFDKNTLNEADVNVGMTIGKNTLTSITNSGTSLVQGTDYTISGNTVSIEKSSLGKLSTGASTILFSSTTGSSQNLTAAISLDQTGANLTMALNGDELTSITNEGNTLVNGTDYIVNGNTVTIKRGFLTKVGTGTVNLVFNFGTQKLAVTISANQTAVNVTMAVNENTLTSITNGIYTLINGIDYDVNGNEVTIKKSYLASLSTGTAALVFNFSEGSPQILNVAVTDTTPVAASGLTVEAAAETPAVSGKVNLTVTPAADSNHKIYYRIVNAAPTALNVGDVITPSDWTEVTDANAHEITVQNGKYIEAVEVSTADNKVTNWGKSGVIADGYIAPVSSSLSTNTSSFDKNTANQANVSVGMTLNGNTLASITNGTYTLVKGTDYTVNGNTVTINKSYLASLSTGTTALVFNFSEGSPQTLSVTVIDTTPGTYTATFKNYDGSTIGSQTVVSGNKIVEPAAPVRTGYTFGGWYKEAACQNKWDFANDTVTAAVTLYAKWTINSYTVTFEDYDGTVIGTPEAVNYGGNATAPANPTRTGYVFAGWDKSYSNVTANLVVTATYTSGNTYDFAPSQAGTSGGTEISTDYLKSRDNTLVITDPTADLSIPASAIDLTNANGADHIKVTEKAVTPQTNTVQGLFYNLPSNERMIGSPLNLSIQLLDVNDNLIKDIHQFANNQKVKVTIKLTAAQIAGLDPSKLSMYYYDETAQKWVELGGSFDPSTKEFSFETTHFTNFAIMNKVYNSNTGTGTTGSYTVIFKDYDGRTIGVPQIVNYGESAFAPANPTRAGYTFTGWDKAFDSVTGDLVVTAQYSANGCTVTFEDYDGTVIGTPETVNYGGSATAPANPTRAGYVFAGWDKAFDKVTGNLVVKATYTSGNTYNFKPTTTSNGEETKISAAYLTSRDNTLVVDSDGAEISIPASAIDLADGTDYIKVTEQDAEADVSKQYGSLPNGLQQVGNPLLLSIQLFDANNNYIEDIHKLANNEKIKVTMKLTADQIKGIDPNSISMYYYDETAKAWLKLDGSFDSKTMEITFYMTSL